MQELVKVNNKVIGTEEVNTVNARELHKKLEVKTRFADWIKRRLEESMAEEGIDYIVLKPEIAENTLFQAVEYFISLDTAKEICMLEKSPKGKEIRKYFIQVEKEYRKNQTQQFSLPQTYKEALLELIKAEEVKEQLMLENKNKQDRLDAYSTIEAQKRKSKEIQTQITKFIRKYASEFMGKDYPGTYRYFYNIYRQCHNLRYGTKIDSNYFKSNISAATELLEIILSEYNNASNNYSNIEDNSNNSISYNYSDDLF